MNVKKLAALLLTGLLAASVCTFTGCGEAGSSQPAATIQLDPSHPVFAHRLALLQRRTASRL